MYGISSWRNIIPYYTLDGAVTEINAEARLRARGGGDAVRRRRRQRSLGELQRRRPQRMRDAMMEYLFNDDTGAFVLNYDQDGNYQDNFTADEVFPVLFGVADPAAAARDPAAPAGGGFRDAGRAAHDLDRRCVVLSLVRIRIARRHLARPDVVVRGRARAQRHDRRSGALPRSSTYAAMEGGSPRNTVPGEFAEWFDGGSLSNRGMYLSPWTGAKYLWAVAETVGGLDGYRTSGRPHLAPLRPKAGNGSPPRACIGAGGAAPTSSICASDTIYGDMPELSAEEPFTCIYAGRDVSDEVTTSPVEVGAIAFEDDDGAVRIFLGNHLDRRAQRAGRVSRPYRARRHGRRRAARSASDRQAERPPCARGTPRRRTAAGARIDARAPSTDSRRSCSPPARRCCCSPSSLGERMGDRVMRQATERAAAVQSVLPTPLTPGADASPAPYGPDWKRSQSLSAAGDPRFPDPRVPPKPLPTLPPATPRPAATVAADADAQPEHPDLAAEAAADAAPLARAAARADAAVHAGAASSPQPSRAAP